MPELIEQPTRVEADGNKPKLIDEFVGRVNNGDERLSIAVMQSPPGWEEPGQRPDFDEYTLVLEGARAETWAVLPLEQKNPEAHGRSRDGRAGPRLRQLG